jgi:hypothetical protein
LRSTASTTPSITASSVMTTPLTCVWLFAGRWLRRRRRWRRELE